MPFNNLKIKKGFIPLEITKFNTLRTIQFFKFKQKKSLTGFTLMEIMVVIAIMAIVLTLSLTFYYGLAKKKALQKDSESLVSLLQNARTLAVASKNASLFGVHLQNDKAVLFKGGSYDASAPYESVLEFAGNVYLCAVTLNGGGTDVVFNRLTGETSDFGTVCLALSDNSASTTLNILRTGVVQ